MGKRLIWILWPSFIIGGIAETVFFTLIDPQELYLLGQPVALVGDGGLFAGVFHVLGDCRGFQRIYLLSATHVRGDQTPRLI